jgi:predicted pyridoxine 5'-phosphate oxidase superfamily flavin-nucleotide-binding protein
MELSPFHADELTAQRLAGGGSGGAGIRDYMTDQHRLFFEALPYVAVAAVDAQGWPMATLLTGAPGFIQAPDDETLRIALPTQPGDPTVDAFVTGQDVGVLGLDLATRRRNRANGRLAALDGPAMIVAVHQSFGNCPQYIQRRTVAPVARTPGPAEPLSTLDSAAAALIRQADTFFVASHARAGAGARGGADISHRGGQPGFVRIDGDGLTIPDFRGNRYFNTLGNLLGDPRAALLFLDFEQGDLLQLQGDVTIDWTGDPGFAGAERLWRFHVQRGWRRRAAVPLRWSFVDQAPTTVRTGVWTH